MAKWFLTEPAEKDIDEILQSVCAFTGFWASAMSLWDALQSKFDLIAFMPRAIGRKRDDNTFEAFCRGYRIVYRVVEGDIYILTVIHSSRLYPRITSGQD